MSHSSEQFQPDIIRATSLSLLYNIYCRGCRKIPLFANSNDRTMYFSCKTAIQTFKCVFTCKYTKIKAIVII